MEATGPSSILGGAKVVREIPLPPALADIAERLVHALEGAENERNSLNDSLKAFAAMVGASLGVAKEVEAHLVVRGGRAFIRIEAEGGGEY